MTSKKDLLRRVPRVIMPKDAREMGIVDEQSQRRYTVRRTKKSGGLVMNAADQPASHPQRES